MIDAPVVIVAVVCTGGLMLVAGLGLGFALGWTTRARIADELADVDAELAELDAQITEYERGRDGGRDRFTDVGGGA